MLGGFRLYCKIAYNILISYWYDFRYAIKYSHSLTTNEDTKLAVIMLHMHGLEKGLSFSNKKQGWGKDKSLETANLIKQYIKKNGRNEVIEVAINILAAYINDPFSSKDDQVVNSIKSLIKENIDVIKPINQVGGVKNISKPSFEFNYDQLHDFISKRSSVRNFSKKPITEEEYINAIRIAELSPSACNRQTCRVYHFHTPEMIDEILELQKGDQGWCRNCTSLFIITSKAPFFNAEYERYEPYIDGGIFSMNFVYGLHIQQIASCYKMYVRDPIVDEGIRKITNIPNNEIPIICILAGHYKDEEIKSPLSHRIDIVK